MKDDQGITMIDGPGQQIRRVVRQLGRRHFPIIIGRQASSFIYAAFLLSAYLAIAFGVYLGYLPKTSLIGLTTIVMAVPAAVGAYRYAEDTENLIWT